MVCKHCSCIFHGAVSPPPLIAPQSWCTKKRPQGEENWEASDDAWSGLYICISYSSSSSSSSSSSYIYIYIYPFIYLFIDFFCEHITSLHTFNFTQIMHMHGVLYIHTEMAICCIYFIASFNHGCVPAFEREIYGIELPNWVKSRCRRREWPWIWLRLSVQHEK